jgi:peptidoglycan hydrolase CwlO-like protein
MRPAHVLGLLVVGVFLMGVSSCDWWPPTLQERIGQQDALIKALTADKAKLQAKVSELSKNLEDANIRAAQTEQANQQLKMQIQELQASLADAQAKATRPSAKRKR